MKSITHISDTHGTHTRLELPGGDILIHSGDFCRSRYEEEVQAFLDWMNAQPYQTKILVAGNHDRVLESYLDKEKTVFDFGQVHYLRDQALETEGIKFYGFPWQPEFFNWAFNLPRNGAEMTTIVEKIPRNVEILISHGPAFGILDQVKNGQHVGCELLAATLPQLTQLKLHCFGHIHESAGVVQNQQGVWFSNGAVFDQPHIHQFIYQNGEISKA